MASRGEEVQKIIRRLKLQPHPEGGHYRESYRSLGSLRTPLGARRYSTAIYYLLASGDVSKMHRLAWDEIFHFYAGDPVVWVLLEKKGKVRRETLGMDLAKGEKPQLVIPAGTWFGGYLKAGGRYALMGTTVAPGFEFRDFELGDRKGLLRRYPSAKTDIFRLT